MSNVVIELGQLWAICCTVSTSRQ